MRGGDRSSPGEGGWGSGEDSGGGLERTFRVETYFGGESGLGGGEGEMRVKGRRREAKENGTAEREQLAVRAAAPRPRGRRRDVSVGFGHREVVPGQWGWKQV